MLKEVNLGNGLKLKHVFTDYRGIGIEEDAYEVWDIDPVDGFPVRTGDYLDYDFVRKTLEGHAREAAIEILVNEIYPY